MRVDSRLGRRGAIDRPKARPRGRLPAPQRGPSRLIALDSDGTVFDSMTSKHELCFMPAFARFFGQGGERAALDEIWRFVNLGSRLRGANRYKALAAALRFGSRHPRVARELRSAEPIASALEAWLAGEDAQSKSRLETALSLRRVDGILYRVLAWSEAVDTAIAALPPPAPFRAAAALLPRLMERNELMILTAAPAASVLREWEEAGLALYATSIMGQERGKKAFCLAAAMEGRFEAERVLVVGDAPGDLEAARAVGARFYPILPGREEESWESFAVEFLPGFVANEGAVPPIAPFLAALPPEPSW